MLLKGVTRCQVVFQAAVWPMTWSFFLLWRQWSLKFRTDFKYASTSNPWASWPSFPLCMGWIHPSWSKKESIPLYCQKKMTLVVMWSNWNWYTSSMPTSYVRIQGDLGWRLWGKGDPRDWSKPIIGLWSIHRINSVEHAGSHFGPWSGHYGEWFKCTRLFWRGWFYSFEWIPFIDVYVHLKSLTLKWSYEALGTASVLSLGAQITGWCVGSLGSELWLSCHSLLLFGWNCTSCLCHLFVFPLFLHFYKFWVLSH